jgi:hypothetical protein
MAGEAGGVLSTHRLELVAERDDKLGDALAIGARARDADGDLQASRRHFERAYRLAEQAVTGLSPSWPARPGSVAAPDPSPIRGNGRG